jgi:hypothetical protein
MQNKMFDPFEKSPSKIRRPTAADLTSEERQFLAKGGRIEYEKTAIGFTKRRIAPGGARPVAAAPKQGSRRGGVPAVDLVELKREIRKNQEKLNAIRIRREIRGY